MRWHAMADRKASLPPTRRTAVQGSLVRLSLPRQAAAGPKPGGGEGLKARQASALGAKASRDSANDGLPPSSQTQGRRVRLAPPRPA